MNTRLIELHREWTGKGYLTESSGLCGSIPFEYMESFQLFVPTEDECISYKGYWGRVYDDGSFIYESYNEFRQTIVLFICAMNDEI